MLFLTSNEFDKFEVIFKGFAFLTLLLGFVTLSLVVSDAVHQKYSEW